MADRVGQQLGNYRLTRLLGRGGFAEVYLGEHRSLKTQAAIKVLHTQLAENDVEGFLKEAQLIASLEHPHIVRILDFDVEDSTPFLVMSYAPNGTLRQRHPKGTILPLSTVVTYVKQVADALQYAHDEKLIHRDVKPENILLGRRSEVLLSDFGIALVAQNTRYANTQEMAGTVAYMSPEQIQGKPRPASDQYALGIVVYEWLTGDRPFHGSAIEIMTQQLVIPPAPLREKVPKIACDVEQIVLRALAKDPKQRFASVHAFAQALAQASQLDQSRIPTDLIGQGQPPAQPPKIPTPPSHFPPSTRKILFLIGMAIIVITGSVGLFNFTRSNGKPPVNSHAPTIAAMSATARTQPTASATTKATAQPTASATATASVRPNPNPYPPFEHLVMNDPLAANGSAYQWEEGENSQNTGNCVFTAGTYHAMVNPGFYKLCLALATNYTDFAYQASITIVQGDEGGIAFRSDRSLKQYYLFYFSRTGDYHFAVCSNDVNTDAEQCSDIITGVSQDYHDGQPNLLTVVAVGSNFDFYVNGQKLTASGSISDTRYSHGEIGVVARGDRAQTDVIIQNVKVWTR